MRSKSTGILVTGGAGFIGSHIVDLLVSQKYDVKVLDNLDHHVHGKRRKVPSYLNKKAQFVYGDLRRRADIVKAIVDVDAVIHLAAKVGVSQSMRQIKEYTATNVLGTANLLDVLVNEENGIGKLIVASSVSIYGEGKYSCKDCGSVYPELRSPAQLERGDWELKCPNCGRTVSPLPTGEEKPPQLSSIYGATKYQQEEMCRLVGKAYGLPIVALRYCNVYGPRQGLSNPYSGCITLFIARLFKNQAPLIFEDGKQVRDFIYVKDVARATALALAKDTGDFHVLNVGTGNPTSIIAVAETLARIADKEIRSLITGKYRVGDIRNCYADVTKMKLVGFKPQYTFEQGLQETLDWVSNQS